MNSVDEAHPDAGVSLISTTSTKEKISCSNERSDMRHADQLSKIGRQKEECEAMVVPKETEIDSQTDGEKQPGKTKIRYVV